MGEIACLKALVRPAADVRPSPAKNAANVVPGAMVTDSGRRLVVSKLAANIYSVATNLAKF